MTVYNNGHVIDVSKTSISDYEIVAKEWSEGNKYLEELLLYCLKNNIVTQACCSGHDDQDVAYLQFEFSKKNMSSIIKIINRYYNLNGVNMIFVNQPGVISKFDIRVSKSIGEQFFKDMLLQLSNGLNIGIDSLTPDMKNTVDAMIKHEVPNEYLEIRYSMNNNQKKMFVATNNYNYSESYCYCDDVKLWVENSIAIDGTPERITPIIKDISEKAPSEYRNYIEKKTGLENQSTINFSKQQSVSEKKVDNEIIPITVNPQATLENDYARKNGMLVVDASFGMSLEEVAKAVCGQKYICRFNNFEIDGTKYANADQVVEAYKKHWEEGKRKFEELKKKQTQIDSSIREQQIQVAINQEVASKQEMQYGGIKR